MRMAGIGFGIAGVTLVLACSSFSAGGGTPGDAGVDGGAADVTAPPTDGSPAVDAGDAGACGAAVPAGSCLLLGPAGCAIASIPMNGSAVAFTMSSDGDIFFTTETPFDGGQRGHLGRIGAGSPSASGLVDTGREPLALTTAGGTVYWSNRDGSDFSQVSSCPIGTNCMPVDTVANRGNSARQYSAIAVASGALFIAEDTGVFRTVGPGYSVPPTAGYLGNATGGVVSFVTDADRVYWIYGNTVQGLLSARHDGTDVIQATMPATPTLPDGGTTTAYVAHSALADDCNYVYLGITYLRNGPIPFASSVHRLLKATNEIEATPLLMVPGQGITSLAVDSAFLYVGRTDGLWVYDKANVATAPQRLSAVTSPKSIQTNDTFLAWQEDATARRLQK